MHLSRNADPLLELIPGQIAEAAENGVDSERRDVAEVRSVGEEAAFFGNLCTDAEVKCHLHRQAGGTQRVDGLEEKNREELSTEAKVLLAECEIFMESLRVFLQQPSVSSQSQEHVCAAERCQVSECGGDDGELPEVLVQDEGATASGIDRQERCLGAGRHTTEATTARGEELVVTAALRVEELNSDERLVVQCVVDRLVEERQGSQAGRTLWTILNRMAGMSQGELNQLVDLYYASERKSALAEKGVDTVGPAVECSAGERVTEAALAPVSGCTAESGVHGESGAGECAESALSVLTGPDEAAGPDDAAGPPERPPDSVAVYCEVCWIWLNGPKQYESHSIGRKHRKRERQRLRARSVAPPAAECDGKVFQ